MNRYFKHLVMLALGFMPMSAIAEGSINLAWNANNESDLAGYRIYYGLTSGRYANSVFVGNVTSQTINNLSGGVTYYFAVTALDQAGNESQPSSEVSVTLTNTTPLPLLISAVAATNLTTSSATISWNTDRAANSQIEFGLDTKYGNLSPIDARMVCTRAVTISNLSPNTRYHYRVKSLDATGQRAASSDLTFQTLVPVMNPTVNLAFRRPAAASSFNGIRTPGKAVDDSAATYWRNGSSGGSQTAWLSVDLKSPQTIGRAVIRWRSSYSARKYELQVSRDGKTWSRVYTTAAGGTGVQEAAFPVVVARFVRIYMTQMNNTSYRVNSFELYAGGGMLARSQSGGLEQAENMDLEDDDVDDDAEVASVPHRFALQQNYPNPFNPHTEIKFELENDSQVILRIYNALGQLVRTLEDGHRIAGEHKLGWDARDDRGQVLPSGMYAYTLEARSSVNGTSGVAKQSRTMTLLK